MLFGPRCRNEYELACLIVDFESGYIDPCGSRAFQGSGEFSLAEFGLASTHALLDQFAPDSIWLRNDSGATHGQRELPNNKLLRIGTNFPMAGHGLILKIKFFESLRNPRSLDGAGRNY
jgi:hypothetical protein